MSVHLHTSVAPCESVPKRRSTLPALFGLLLFELIGWSALRVGLDRQLGFGARFWGVVVLAAATCLMVWLSLRALVIRRGWFTLKEFLVFVLLIGAVCGWLGNRYQQTREQRQIADFLSARGARLFFGGSDELGFERLLGREYFHGIRYVDADLRVFTAEDLAVLTRLHDLEALRLHNGAVTDDHLRHLQGLTSLRGLVVDAATIDDAAFKPLRGHPGLQRLSVYQSTIAPEALVHLRDIPQLESLELETAPITDAGMVHVGQCTLLKSLVVSHAGVTDAGLVDLLGLRHLADLSLCEPAVTDAGIVHLSSMESLTGLDLSGTSVTDAGLEPLVALKQLKSLGIRRTPVTPERAQRLWSEMPNLRLVQY